MEPLSNPQKEINILLMGETGVGKSTFINAFANYLTFNKLEDVKKDNLICLIPTTFTVTDFNYEDHLISIGEDVNEVHDPGQASTQSCRSYRFPFGDQLVRLIDTPGVGDPRGVEQDAKNFLNILTFISNYTELHGICILLKPNNSRLTVTFNFCIKELLCHLHKSASRNIIFLFTHSRGTFYRPGDTSRVLKTMLTEIHNKPPYVDIKFDRSNTFYLENESFRFTVALLHGVEFDEAERKDFSGSWDKSVSQCGELLNYIQSLESHKVQDTLSLNQARNLIITLRKPLADITEIIQINLEVLQEHKNKVKSSADNISELQKHLYTPVIKLENIPLTKPQTVCGSYSCSTVHDYKGQTQIEYTMECHSPCYLTTVPVQILGPSELLSCAAMNSSGICTKCQCSWQMHMHILYKSKRVRENIINESTQSEILSKEEAKEKAELKAQELDRRCELLEKEQKIITNAFAKFGHFLKHNAITPYNDALKEYLDYLIQNHKRMNDAGLENAKTINGLEKMKKEYIQELEILTKSVTHSIEIPQPITSISISEIANKLYGLEINGPVIKNLLDELNEAKTREHFEYRERTYEPPSEVWSVGPLYRAIIAQGRKRVLKLTSA